METSKQSTRAPDSHTTEPCPGSGSSQSPHSTTNLSSKSFSQALRNLFFKELVLGPDPKLAAAVKEDKDSSLASTIKGATGILLRDAPLMLVGKASLALAAASVPLVWSWLSGNVVGSFSSLVPDLSAAPLASKKTVTWGIETAIVSVGIFAILSDLQGRIGNWFNSWEEKTISRLSKRLAFQVTDTWTYEDLENSKKQLAYERFKEHSGKLFDMLTHSIEAASAVIVSLVAVGLLCRLDWRLSFTALAFMGARVFRDLRESKTSFAIERVSAEERRVLNVRESLSSDPRQSRDTRLLGQTTSLQDEYQAGTLDIHRRMLANERRVQLVRLCYDLIPAAIQLTSVALILKGVATASIPIKDAVAFMGYSFNLIYQCRGVGYQIGKMLQAKTFAAEGLEFLRSALTEQTHKVKIPESPSPPTIRLTSVQVQREDRCILDVPHLQIKPGEIVGIVGLEGAGKSTFLKAILGLRALSAGSVSLSWGSNDYCLADCHLPSFHRLVACNNQDFSLPEGMTVREILNLGVLHDTSLSTLSPDDALALAEAAPFIQSHSQGMDTTVGAGWATKDSEGNENESVSFSPGQRKLIGLAATLMTHKPIIVLDEPSSGVSPETSRRVLAKICEQAKSRGATVIIVSHHFENFSFADRILSIEKGQIVQDGPPEQLSHAPGTFRNGVIGTANQTLAFLNLRLRATNKGYSLQEEQPAKGSSSH